MPRRARIRSLSKWTFALLAAAVIATTIFSRWRTIEWVRTDADGLMTSIRIDGGTLLLDRVLFIERRPNWLRVTPAPRWNWGWTTPWHCGVLYDNYLGITKSFGITLLYPALLTTLVASILWRWDLRARHRERAGHCLKCAYNRRGLAENAPCPECGTKNTSSKPRRP